MCAQKNAAFSMRQKRIVHITNQSGSINQFKCIVWAIEKKASILLIFSCCSLQYSLCSHLFGSATVWSQYVYFPSEIALHRINYGNFHCIMPTMICRVDRPFVVNHTIKIRKTLIGRENRQNEAYAPPAR